MSAVQGFVSLPKLTSKQKSEIEDKWMKLLVFRSSSAPEHQFRPVVLKLVCTRSSKHNSKTLQV